MDQPSIKDSGTRRKFDSGAVRDAETGKGRFDLISPIALTRLAQHYESGAVKYSARNWEKGIPLSTFMDSTLRHLNKYREGIRDEDHITAALWNVAGFIHTEEMIKRELLPKELDDLPCYLPPPLSKEEPVTASEAILEAKKKQDVAYRQFFGYARSESPKKITAYLSHPIRGRADGRPEKRRIKENNEKAKKIAKQIQTKWKDWLDLYCPAIHDEVLQILYDRKAISIDELLAADCVVLERRDIHFIYLPKNEKISEGMKVEINHSVRHNIPSIIFSCVEDLLSRKEEIQLLTRP